VLLKKNNTVETKPNASAAHSNPRTILADLISIEQHSPPTRLHFVLPAFYPCTSKTRLGRHQPTTAVYALNLYIVCESAATGFLPPIPITIEFAHVAGGVRIGEGGELTTERGRTPKCLIA